MRQPPATSSEEEEAAIEHLMETPGLELTRTELESLFNLVDETGGGEVQRSSNKDDSAGPQHNSGSLQQQRVLTSHSSLLLFLRRCGLRRSEGWHGTTCRRLSFKSIKFGLLYVTKKPGRVRPDSY